MEYFSELLSILNEMSPYLLLGFFLSGLLHIYMPKGLFSRVLNHKGWRSVIGAALLGVPLPLCSCGVIPAAVSLKKEGASPGAVSSFLAATPQTGIDSFLVTYSILGLPFALVRTVAAIGVAILAGTSVDKFGNDEKAALSALRLAHESHCHCGCSHSKGGSKIMEALRYGYIVLMRDFGKWLLIGLFIAAAISAFVPESLFTICKEHYILNIALIVLISAPMYICATGSIPIALSLMLKGLSPGAAFVLLLAGPATNIASVIILRREIGLRNTLIYIFAIIFGAIVAALVIDFLLPHDWFSSLSPITHCCHESGSHEHCTHGPVWWQTITSIIFIALFINASIEK